MAEFIKLETEKSTFYINIENIVAVNKEKCIVHTENDNFFITPDAMWLLIQEIEKRVVRHDE